MRPTSGRFLGLVCLALVSVPGLTLMLTPQSAAADEPLGYRVLGDLAVMDRGRIKPLSTLAIDRVKSIYSRQTIKLKNPDGTTESWGPVAAYLDWSARPDYWNDKEFILAEYLPLKEKVLDGAVRSALETVSAAADTPADLKTSIAEALKAPVIDHAGLAAIVSRFPADSPSRVTLANLARKLSPDTKWLSPNDLESAEIDVDGQPMSLFEWFSNVLNKREKARTALDEDGTAQLSDLEKKVAEVAERLAFYEAIRDGNPRGAPALDLNVMPRPVNEAYLQFTSGAYLKQMADDGHGHEGTPLETIAIKTLSDYLRDQQSKDRRLPGALPAETVAALEKESPEALAKAREEQQAFNDKYAAWVRNRADWIPLRVLLSAELDELNRAGFPSDRVAAFRAAFTALAPAEKAAPHKLDPARAQSLLAAARELGNQVGGYPSAAAMARESHFNRLAPFYLAPMAFGLGFIALLLSVGITARPDTLVGKLGSTLYGLGLAGLATGIALEGYGFYLRVAISGWAPVTNMYETVIWVSLFTAVLGFIYELISRKKYVALAATGVSLLTAVLAANVSLLDPSIKSLPPVLRSNYWLTIHVLTIVSSYAAFALSLMLGLIAVGFYLTASYRRSAGYVQLGAPAVPGLPMLVAGAAGLVAVYSPSPPSWLAGPVPFAILTVLTGIGGMLTIMGGFAVFGELANRAPRVAAAISGLAVAVTAPLVILVMADQLPRPFNGAITAYAAWIGFLLAGAGLALSIFGAQARAILNQALAAVEAQRSVSQSAQARAVAGVEARADALLHHHEAGGGVATLPELSTLDRIRSAVPAPLDARRLAMQSTASRIKPIANFIYRAMQVGVLLCAAGTILGGVWANDSWGRFWGWDAKEVWALATLIFYLVPLHGRFAGWVNTFGLVVASVVCFSSVLMAWYGVNFVLGVGLHSYGFVEGGSQGIVLACCLAVVAVMGGAWWRRKLSSMDDPAVMAG
jgi:ABC-type transport system involved in cytochrome c biogenesis permease subunit